MRRPAEPQEQREQSAVAPALYQWVRTGGATDEATLRAEFEVGGEELGVAWTELKELGLVHAGSDGSSLSVVDPEAALLRLLDEQRRYMNLHRQFVDRGMWAVESLVGRYRHTVEHEQGDIEVEVIRDARRINRLLDDLVDLVQSDVASLHPGPLPPAEVLRLGLERDRGHVERGARVRTVYPTRFAALPYVQQHLQDLLALGSEVRLSPTVPLHIIVADGRIALLPIDPDEPGKGVILARGATLVRSYAALYEYCWHAASPVTADHGVAPPGHAATEQQRAVVRLMATGIKDEQVARHLGISPRTVSRVMSEVMQQLGAESRFQAGVRALELGWLSGSAPAAGGSG
ncbi:LuxR C-terminal-related transcriptional regulator [Streptomyces sp. NPDC007971]|uniref:helix-turn-helix transcriptional regulator n=1 Tax=Streptomyces sp. NPDC007971 TaxID=3364799 RepID=UPI0036F12CBE